jgi:hypothetical protein
MLQPLARLACPTFMRRALLSLLVIAIAAAPVAADRGKGTRVCKPRSPAIDVAGAIASGDPARRCDAAIALVAAKQHARASFLIGACMDLADRADAARAARVAIAKRATREEWSPVEIDVRGGVAAITIDAFPDVVLAPGRHLLPAGTYEVVARGPTGTASQVVVLAANSRALVMLTMPTPAAPPTAGVVDFGKDDGTPMDRPISGPPPPAKHESLLPERYRKGLRRCGALPCRTSP